MGFGHISLWYFSVKDSVWVYNRVPNQISGITPIKILTKTEFNNQDLRRAHVWRCHIFVLEAKLQDNQKLPKWNNSLRLRQFLGLSDDTPHWLRLFVTSKLDIYHLNITLFLMIYLRPQFAQGIMTL